MLRILTTFSVFAVLICFRGFSAYACPFCSAVSQTFSEEMATMDVVAIAELKRAGQLNAIDTSNPQAEVPKSQFVITKVIKGKEYIQVGDTFDTIYFGEAKKDRAFLAMATDAPNLIWSTPLILSDRAETYLSRLRDLSDGPERLVFFQEYLEDKDEMLARDAYDEFAKAPYADVIALKPKMNREQLLQFIQDPDVPTNRRRLYFTMLGVCGTKDDASLLEGFMESEDRKAKAGLDSMLACYMILTGEDGLDRVDELFLKRKEAAYQDTYAAIMAIRFHDSETDVIPRSRLVKSLRYMLDRPELADLVIPDLARWEDWEIMPRLVDLFITADENSSWVRVPVINYLRACPLPTAKERIEELKEIDADSVNRAMKFFPITTEKKTADDTGGDKTEPATSESATPKPAATSRVQPVETDVEALVHTPTFPGSSRGEVAQVMTQGATNGAFDANRPESLTRIDTPSSLSQVEAIAESSTNAWVLIGFTFLGGGLCFVAMRSILGVKA